MNITSIYYYVMEGSATKHNQNFFTITGVGVPKMVKNVHQMFILNQEPYLNISTFHHIYEN